MIIQNPILATDSYKPSHWLQYPPGTARVHSYFEARGMSDRFAHISAASGFEEVVAFPALQALLPWYLQRVRPEHIQEAEEIFRLHFGNEQLFNKAGWEYIVKKHDGFLPVRIRAVPEGTRVPLSNVLLTAENTDPEVPWLTNYLETRLSHIWYPITVATLSHHCRRIILKWLEMTGTPEEIDFKLHDFGYRGVETEQSAAVGGLAHLVNFQGSDTLAAVVLARQAYHTQMAAFSIPAAEHSTITSWGSDAEPHAVQNMLVQYPTGLVAIVSDSFNIYALCEKVYGEMLKDQILAREGRVIIRPDSGDPSVVVPKVLDILGQKFGWELNQKGYRVLHPKVRIIQGDGMNALEIHNLLWQLMSLGWSADNIAFGMGGGLLQNVNRDDLKCAFKCSQITFRDGRERGVWKNPITDPGKKSKIGRVTLYADGDRLYTAENTLRTHPEVMQTVWEDGFLLVNDSLDVVRSRALQRMPAGV